MGDASVAAEPPQVAAPSARRWRPPVGVVAVVAGLGGALVGGLAVRAIVGPASDVSACDVQWVADRVLPSVVTITAASASGNAGTGTGEVVAAGGYVLTNQHVVSPAGSDGRLTVQYSDGSHTDATLVGEDVATDLAVVKADDEAAGRPVIGLGSSADLRVGRPVVALGAPLGLSGTVTAGIVSALGRYVPVPTGSGQLHHLIDAIQTDAAINPGNSGGPLVDCDGAMIGVSSAIATVPDAAGVGGGGSVGLGFAIPVGVAGPIAHALITTGTANHPVVGLTAHTVAGEGSGPSGLLVTEVAPGSPAADAGLRAQDVVVAINGSPARTTDDLVLATLTHTAGDTLSLTYLRDGTSRETELVLGEPPA